ncbi:acyl-CoA dehydrogenase family protein [Xenophilus azovorans]|uniref:acyl-CoA dehydrogenase family protein n=1 Tax=Xenophilus azovorans TaxID=151755 RepID=UPI0005712690|nr:acyl-CoA dehydrogenase family protein [Xenophilus azovorans]
MDFDIPEDIRRTLNEIDAFVERELVPLEQAHPQYFDHRREFARTDWERDGIPSAGYEAVVREARDRCDRAGFLRMGLPRSVGGQEASNLAVVIIREHLSARGIGLQGNLHDEQSVVPSIPMVHLMEKFGSPEQKARYLEGLVTGDDFIAFALTEPDHGSDATWLETTAVRDGDHWILNGRKRFNSGVHKASADLVFARTSGQPGDADGITAFLVPMDTPGLKVEYYHWCFNMPSDHAEVSVNDMRVPHSAVVGRIGHGLDVAQNFVHQNRIRQAAQSVGVARYCVQESVKYARARKTFGRPIAQHQAIQFPIAEMHAEVEMLRSYVFKVANELDRKPAESVSDQVAIANFRANRLACNAADLAMQVHGGIGYTRGKPFEHIYRHFRRYRITEGSDEVQIRKIAAYLFGYAGPGKQPAAKKDTGA